MAGAPRDPREIITPDAFSVAPELLGIPLARPWRRAVAMAIDLIAIVIIGGAGWFVLGLAVSFLLFRMALRPAAGLLMRGARRAAFGSLGALALTVTLAGGWMSWFGDGASVAVDAGGRMLQAGFGEAGATVAEVLAVTQAESEAEMRDAATRFAERLRSQGADPDEIREALEGIAAGREEPWAHEAVLGAIASLDTVQESTAADSLVFAYASALQANDSARAAALRAPLVDAIAAEPLGRQESRIERLRDENARLGEDLEKERERGLIRTILKVADEVGIGFGWAGLYFTVFLVLWRGRTPGKRLLRIRVVRLDGKAIGWWASFNRFGGYAASIFTGLLGFFEMYWDANRQALHDRIAATVVVRE